jgi:hypothetical protein
MALGAEIPEAIGPSAMLDDRAQPSQELNAGWYISGSVAVSDGVHYES